MSGVVLNRAHRGISIHRSRAQQIARALSTPSGKLFDKILIANRGEIACRVIRTARRLGIKTVAVYSDADRFSEHVQFADEAVYIGASPASESYLRGDKIIEACKKTGAQAVHPGYGFLSENLPFCQLCEDAGVVFIGPPPKAIRAMGSKSESKDIMIQANVPVTPGYHGNDQSNENLLAQARSIGYPVMIKAVSGGGGKGMRAVFDDSKFLESLESCRREGLKSFNDANVLIEKLVQAPRHVEVQVFGDSHGNAIHLMERDCSVQRRHQKVLEEAPAPNLAPRVRKALGDAAVACAKAVGYVGAGTVEFLVDSVTQDFYFCEMNTRLQVEHPVTEMITGTDLVEWQLRVAAGHTLPLTQEELMKQVKGCAMEARIYAENPLKDFLPATGQILHLRTPLDEKICESGVRVDSGIRSGDSVSTFYDPMIAKLIAYGETREEARLKLERALRNFQVAGLANNIDFLVKIVLHPTYAKAACTTAFFEHHMNGLLDSLKPRPLSQLPIPVSIVSAVFMESQRAAKSHGGMWQRRVGDDWRNSSKVSRQFSLQNGDELADISIVTQEMEGEFSVQSKHLASTQCRLLSKEVIKSMADGLVWKVVCEVNGHRAQAFVALKKNSMAHNYAADLWIEGTVGEDHTHYHFTLPFEDFSSSSNASSNPIVLSPMPGKVVKVCVTDGASVKKGDTIVILEAMKMEHTVAAPCDGVVSVMCSEGFTVSEGSKLAEVAK